nr:hypothetical protein HK105_005582 [Polyrhizophydium stewartii]
MPPNAWAAAASDARALLLATPPPTPAALAASLARLDAAVAAPPPPLTDDEDADALDRAAVDLWNAAVRRRAAAVPAESPPADAAIEAALQARARVKLAEMHLRSDLSSIQLAADKRARAVSLFEMHLVKAQLAWSKGQCSVSVFDVRQAVEPHILSYLRSADASPNDLSAHYLKMSAISRKSKGNSAEIDQRGWVSMIHLLAAHAGTVLRIDAVLKLETAALQAMSHESDSVRDQMLLAKLHLLMLLWRAGDSAADKHNWADALEWYSCSLGLIAENIADRRNSATLLRKIALCHLELGDTETALAECTRGEAPVRQNMMPEPDVLTCPWIQRTRWSKSLTAS